MKALSLLFAFLFLFQPVRAQWKGFAAPVVYDQTADVPNLLATDISGDHKPDLIIMYPSAETRFGVRIGYGDGTFGEEQFRPKEENYHLFDVGDLNKDGIVDLVVSSYWNNGFKIRFGQPGGFFDEGTYYSTGVHGRSIKCTDIDQDGNLDILAITAGSGRPIVLHVYKGDGRGNFTKISYPSELDTDRDIFVVDKNQDGLFDVIVTSSFPWIGLYYQQADGSFRIQYWPTHTIARSVFADLNNDQKVDWIQAYSAFDNLPDSDSVVVKPGEEDTLFSQQSLVIPYRGLRPYHIATADMNQDGNQDLLLSQLTQQGELTDTLFYLAGNGDFTFDPPVPISLPGPLIKMQITQLNADAFPDLLVSCRDKRVAVLLNQGSTPTGNEEPKELSAVRIFPNPGHDLVNLDLPEQTLSVSVYNAYGTLVWSAPCRGKTALNVLPWESGIYVVSVANEHSTVSLKFNKP